MATVFLGLGTNLGDRAHNLEHAISLLPPEIQIESFSAVYESEPWGFSDQPHFLNMAAGGTTHCTPEEVLQHIKDIELRAGRQPTFRYGPRIIDIDLLFYDSRVLDTPDLIIPHPHLHKRAFVLVPLAEIAPALVHPVLNLNIRQLLDTIPPEDAAAIQLFQPKGT